MKTQGSKFNNIVDGTEVYASLEKLIWRLAWNLDNPENAMMQAEEIAGELSLEVAKGMKVYGHLPQDELMKVLKCMIGYRISELKYKNYMTHRKAASLVVSLELESEIDNDMSEKFGVPSDVEDRLESEQKFTRLINSIHLQSAIILHAIIYGDDGLREYLDSHCIKPADKIKPEYLAEGLQMDLKVVRSSITEIKQAYKDIYEQDFV
jgi:hypothetical protein